jgi:hypothetical protein
MNKVKVYRKIGLVLLSVWIIVWVVSVLLILKSSIPYASFKGLVLQAFLATIFNLALNPCAFVGAILLDLATINKAPSRKPGWFRLVIIYLILWVSMFIFVLWVSIPRGFEPGMKMIEKPLRE